MRICVDALLNWELRLLMFSNNLLIIANIICGHVFANFLIFFGGKMMSNTIHK